MKKQNIIMGIGFVLLFVMVIGVSYAAYKFSAAGTKGADTLIKLTNNQNNSGLYTITHPADSTLQIGAPGRNAAFGCPTRRAASPS